MKIRLSVASFLIAFLALPVTSDAEPTVSDAIDHMVSVCTGISDKRLATRVGDFGIAIDSDATFDMRDVKTSVGKFDDTFGDDAYYLNVLCTNGPCIRIVDSQGVVGPKGKLHTYMQMRWPCYYKEHADSAVRAADFIYRKVGRKSPF